MALKTFGVLTDNSGSNSSSADRMVASPATPTSNGIIESLTLRAYLSSAGTTTLKGIIYTDLNGSPDLLFATSDEVTITNTSEQAITVTFTGNQRRKIVKDTQYWIGFAQKDPGTPSVVRSQGTTSSLQVSNTFTYSSGLPSTWSAPTLVSGPLDVYVTYTERFKQKKYIYKVYDGSGNYIETWDDVVSEISMTQEINSPASEITIKLARDPQNFGEEEDVKFNNIVKVYVDDSESDNELFFQGYIVDYTPKYGSDYVELVVFSFGAELDSFIHGVDETADQNQATGATAETFGNGKQVAQSFIPADATLTGVDVKLSTPSEIIATLTIQTDSGGSPSGTAITNGTIIKTISNTSAEVIRFTFTTPPTLTIGATYWVVLA